jgi:hypothetical protein
MRKTVRLLLASLLVASLGCASGQSGGGSEPPVDVSGIWSGTITIPTNSVLRCCGALSGLARVELQQDDNRISGSFDAPGFQGTITAWVKRDIISGYTSYRAGMSAGSGRFDATVTGNEMVLQIMDSKLILSRVH